MKIWERIKNWKTTVMGGAVGLIGAAIVAKVMSDAGCHFESVNWAAIGTYAFSQIVGALSTDNGQSV